MAERTGWLVSFSLYMHMVADAYVHVIWPAHVTYQGLGDQLSYLPDIIIIARGLYSPDCAQLMRSLRPGHFRILNGTVL